MEESKRILEAIEKNDAGASSELLPLVYKELRALAAKRIADDSAGQTLQATALVHEAYLRLVGDRDSKWNGRGHFFAAAAEAMRRILIDRARAKKREMRGGGRRRFDLSPADLTIDAITDDVLDLGEALEKLAAEDPVKADLLKLRFFGGLSMREDTEFLGLSKTAGDRYWAYAHAFLFAELCDPTDRT